MYHRTSRPINAPTFLERYVCALRLVLYCSYASYALLLRDGNAHNISKAGAS